MPAESSATFLSVSWETASVWQEFSNCLRKDLDKMDEQCEKDTVDTVRGYRGLSGASSVDLTRLKPGSS